MPATSTFSYTIVGKLFIPLLLCPAFLFVSGCGGRTSSETNGQNRAPAVQTPQSSGDPIRAMRDAMEQIEKISISAHLSTPGHAMEKRAAERLRELYRDLEYNIDVSKCPQDFQTAFDKYKKAFNTYMESVVEVGRYGMFDGTERQIDNARSAFFDARDEKLKAAMDDLKFVVNKHSK